MERVYVDLSRLAEKHLHRRYGPRAGDTLLEPSALVNETYLRLIRQRKRFDNRGQFFAIATRVMLRVLVDHHRKQGAVKRFGGQIRVSLSGLAEPREPSASVPAFKEAIERLSELDQRTADVVKLRLLWGLSVPEIARCLELSTTTVEREWRFGRNWLSSELAGSD